MKNVSLQPGVMVPVLEMRQLPGCKMTKMIIEPRPRVVPTEPFFVPVTLITGMEAPLVRAGLVTLILWADGPAIPGDPDAIERQVVSKLAMTADTYEIIKRMLTGVLDG